MPLFSKLFLKKLRFWRRFFQKWLLVPVRFIRYNPDYYEPVKGQRKIKLKQRENKLIEYVKYAIKHSPIEEGCMASVLYLFYDDYDTTHQVWNRLI